MATHSLQHNSTIHNPTAQGWQWAQAGGQWRVREPRKHLNPTPASGDLAPAHGRDQAGYMGGAGDNGLAGMA